MSTKFRDRFESMLQPQGNDVRFTQDTPVYPDVWRKFAAIATTQSDSRAERIDLLLTPHRRSTSQDLAASLVVRLSSYTETTSYDTSPTEPSPSNWLRPYRICLTDTHVCASLSFAEIVCVTLPMTKWWKGYVLSTSTSVAKTDFASQSISKSEENSVTSQIATAAECSAESGRQSTAEEMLTNGGQWFIELCGLLWWRMRVKNDDDVKKSTVLRRATELFNAAQTESETPQLWGISCNREAELSLRRSLPAIKADAAEELFHPNASELAWAVIDSGIDATHSAFRRFGADGEPYAEAFEPPNGTSDQSKNNTRIIETYNFTKLRERLALRAEDLALNISQIQGTFDEQAKELRKSLAAGRFFNWQDLLDEVKVEYHDGNLAESLPTSDHGTHVAGILAGDWKQGSQHMVGVCRDLTLYDLRVADQNGVADEFSVLAALHFIRCKNATSDRPLIHGVNISMSLKHDVRSYACGRTPVCEESNRLVGSGVVVVVAAGNRGYAGIDERQFEEYMGYQASTITDPGNAENVITVGSTHRFQPHRYGVSFFSSRGPTGDGRMKPDLVAPGEKITAPVPGERSKSLDGTSMAAPHVSGAAAILMARYSELIGEPQRIKQILCETATDLGRERHFQGAGMLDILRALQSM